FVSTLALYRRRTSLSYEYHYVSQKISHEERCCCCRLGTRSGRLVWCRTEERGGGQRRGGFTRGRFDARAWRIEARAACLWRSHPADRRELRFAARNRHGFGEDHPQFY